MWGYVLLGLLLWAGIQGPEEGTPLPGSGLVLGALVTVGLIAGLAHLGR